MNRFKIHLKSWVKKWFRSKEHSPEVKKSNFDGNKDIWDNYAEVWSVDDVVIEDKSIKKDEVTILGDEWGEKKGVDEIVNEFILPYLKNDSIVAEIGIGGARIASKIVGKIKHLYGFDISENMLKRAREAMKKHDNFTLNILKEPIFPREFHGKFDFIYSFDVFVHLDLHMIWKYLNQISFLIKDGGFVFLHTSNLAAVNGWERFEKQDNYKIEGFYFVSPEIVKILTEKAGFKIIKESSVEKDNFYYKRDYLFIIQKKFSDDKL